MIFDNYILITYKNRKINNMKTAYNSIIGWIDKTLANKLVKHLTDF